MDGKTAFFRHTRLLLSALVAVLILGLSACGASKTATGTATATAVATTAAAAQSAAAVQSPAAAQPVAAAAPTTKSAAAAATRAPTSAVETKVASTPAVAKTSTASRESGSTVSETALAAPTPSPEAAEKAKAKVEAAAAAEAARIAALNVPDPVIKTKGGIFAGPVQAALEPFPVKEAVVAYTLDGSEPSAQNGLKYDAPFTISSSAVLRVRAFVIGGKSSGIVSAEYGIGEICAAPGGTGDGRRGSPLGAASAAIAKAVSLGMKTVKLASGTFDESLDLTSAGVLVSGGWKSDFSAIGGARTVIRGKASGSSSKKAPAAALRISGKAADSTLRLERLELRGGDSSYSAGILVTDGASPRFVDCASYGGSGSYGYGAVVTGGSSPDFRSCNLDGGEAATSYGLSADGATAAIASSFLRAGTGTVGGYGVVATDARVSVASSVIAGNVANVSYGAAFYNSKGSSLENCTIVGGSGKDVSGVFISSSDPSIENCIVTAEGSGKSYGIAANYGESAPSRLAGNQFVGCSGGVYWDAGAKIAYASFDAAGRLVSQSGAIPPKPKGEGNAKGSFSLGSAPDYETPGGAVLPAVKTLPGASAIDVRGRTRGEPRRSGAYAQP